MSTETRDAFDSAYVDGQTPSKQLAREIGTVIDAQLEEVRASLASIGEGVVAGDARIVSTLAILDGNLNFSAGTIAVVYNDGANSGYYLKIGASGTGSWSKISAMTLPAEIIDRVTALETDVAALGAMSLKDTVALTDIEQIPDQTILGRTGPGTGSGPVNAMTPTQARNLIDAPSKADLEDVSWYSFSVGDSTSCIFIGDSLTAGFGAMMNKGPIQKISAYTNIVCHNYGRPSYTTEGLLTSLRAQTLVFLGNIQTLRPTYGMILTGANDTGTFAEREGWLRQLGETAAGQGLEVSFTRSHYWIGGEQASILYSALAERFGGDFVDVRRAYNLFCLTGKTEGFWFGNHPGTRTNEIFSGPLTEWVRGKVCQQSIKLFRARDDSASIADLIYHPADFYARDQRWREICVGERSIAPEDSSLYDTIQDGFNVLDRNSEYMSIMSGNSLNMGNAALVVITMPANAANLESVQIDIGADVDACYYLNPIVSPYAAAGETVGNWAPVTLSDRTFTFNEIYLSRAVWGDQIVLLLTAAAGVQLSAPIVRWKGRPGKPALKAKPALAGGEYLAATDAGAAGWVLAGGAVQRAPSDGSLPVGCTRVIALDAGESVSQPIDLPAESVDARELELTVWVRRPPTVSVGIATHDTARVSVGLSSGALAATGDVVAGLWWRECKVRLTVPPGLAAPSLVITTDRPVEIARGGVALVGAGSATGSGDPSEAAAAAQAAAVTAQGAAATAQGAADDASASAASAAGLIFAGSRADFVLVTAYGLFADLPDGASGAVDGMLYTRRTGSTVIPDLPGWEPGAPVNAEQFGVVPGVLADPAVNDVRMAAALLYAKTHGTPIFALAPVYVFSDTVAPHPGTSLFCGGLPRWIPGYTAAHVTFRPKIGEGTVFLFKGTGPKRWTVDNISDMSHAGGVVANPSLPDAYTAAAPSPAYALADFTNGDASGATKATLRPFSVGLRLPDAGGVTVRDVALVPWCDGLDGYGDDTNTSLGDAWDVGVWADNSSGNHLDNVAAVGYWRISGWLKTLTIRDGAVPVYGEADRFINPRAQGVRGFSARGMDVFRIVAVTATTISIPWSKSHRFDPTGSVRANATDFAYSGLSFSDGLLTFTGIASTSLATVGSELRKSGSNFGTSGTQIIAPYITDLMHHTRLLSTSPLLDSPAPHMGQAIELSGEPLRAIQFWGGTVLGRDDVLVFLKDTTDTIFFGTYFEGQPGRSVVGGANSAIDRGGRIIAQKSSDSPAPFPAGQVQGLRWVGCTFGPGVDRLPFVAESSGATRFTTPGNLYKPREDFDDTRAFPAITNGETRIVSLADARIHHADGGKTYIGPAVGNSRIQSRVGELNLESGLRVTLGYADGTKWVAANSGAFYPATSGVLTLGAPGNLWAQGYSTNSAFSTSDARAKDLVGDVPDAWLDAWAGVRWVRYKLTEAIAAKGPAARWHLGLIAQEIVAAFEASGIPAADLMAVGLIGFDQWPDEYDPVTESRPVLDADGAETGSFELVDTGEQRLVRAAGDAWSVRYEEALALEAAWSRREIGRLAARITALEDV